MWVDVALVVVDESLGQLLGRRPDHFKVDALHPNNLIVTVVFVGTYLGGCRVVVSLTSGMTVLERSKCRHTL